MEGARLYDAATGALGFRRWLHRIANNVCLDILKSATRKVAANAQSYAEVPWLQPYPDQLLDEDAAGKEQVALGYLALIQLLPAQQRAVFVLRDMLGWSAQEAADALDVSGPHLAEFMKPGPIYQHYAKVAPRPEDFGKLIGETGAMARRDRDWMAALPTFPPTLLLYGDADMVRPQHIVEVYAGLGGGLRDPGWDGGAGRSASQLAILPGVNHYAMAQHPLLAATVERFLSEA